MRTAWPGPPPVGARVPISIDTRSPSRAWALAAGDSNLNDSGDGSADGELERVVPSITCRLIIMHNREAADPEIDTSPTSRVLFPARSNRGARGHARAKTSCSIRNWLRQNAPNKPTAIARLVELKSFGLPLSRRASPSAVHRHRMPQQSRNQTGRIDSAHLLARRQAGRRFIRHPTIVAETGQADARCRAIGSAR